MCNNIRNRNLRETLDYFHLLQKVTNSKNIKSESISDHNTSESIQSQQAQYVRTFITNQNIT